ncbi:MAG: hypothetical protein IJ816_01245 [Alloprevotella sp.]|nr:hypothetical protein [Alloprevotella sp.]
MLPEKPQIEPFKVPEGYFEQLQEQILMAIDKQAAPTKKFTLKKSGKFPMWLRYTTGIAASVVLFFAFSHIHEHRFPTTAQNNAPEYEISNNLYLAGLNTNDMYEYMSAAEDFHYDNYEEN